MQFNLRLLTAIAVMAVSGIAYSQSSGTAFVVAPGLLVTNHHVIDGCGEIEVIASDGRRPATVVDSVQQIDLALLRVYGLRGGVASLRTRSPTLLGESATVFGFPLGGALSSTGNFTTGVVSSLRGLRDAAGEIQITAPVQPGNSGGPVLDRSGAVIGVVQSKLDALKTVRATGDIPQNVNFAVSLDVLTDFLEKNNVQFKSAERQPAIESTQIAEMAQSFTYKISCTRATRTATAPQPQNPLPAGPTPDKLVQDIQTALNQKGFNAGPTDGFIGPQTKTAIIAAQRMFGLSQNGLPSSELLVVLRKFSATKQLNPELKDQSIEEQADFEKSMQTFVKGQYEQTVRGLSDFIAQYKNSKMIPKAKFYLGSSYYAMKNFKSSLKSFLEMAESHPSDSRAADALFMAASCQIELSDREGARKTLKRLINDYPSSRSADIAAKRLPLI